MAETTYVPNLYDLGLMTAEVYQDAHEVPDETWRQLQRAVYEDAFARTGQSDRAAAIARLADFPAWVVGRVDRNEQAGQDGWEALQQFGPSLVVVTRDVTGQALGGVIAAENVSAGERLPGRPGQRLARVEMRGKWAVGPGSRVPLLGGRRYVHTEVIAHPDAQPVLPVRAGEIAVSGVMLDGIWRAERHFDTRQTMNIYLAPEDQADATLAAVTSFLGLHRVRSKITSEQPGYPIGTRVATMQGNVGDTLIRINTIPDYRRLREQMDEGQ